MNKRKPKQGVVVIIFSFMLLLIASLHTPMKSTGKVMSERMEFSQTQKSSSVSSFLNQIIGEPNEKAEESNEVVPKEPVAEPNEITAESALLGDTIWYASTWDSTLYDKARFPKQSPSK